MLPRFSRRGLFSRSVNKPRRRTPLQNTIESLEPRQMLTVASADGSLYISQNPYEDFGRIADSLAKAADLSRYSALELANVSDWIVLRPAFDDWYHNGFGAAPIATGVSTFGSQPATVTQPDAVSTPAGAVTWMASQPVDAQSTTSPSTPQTGPTSTTLSATVEYISRFPGAETWHFPAGTPWQTIAAELTANAGAGRFYPLVAHRVGSRFIPNDEFFGEQWTLRNRGQNNGISGQDANVAPAWDTVKGDGVVVGIVDNGVDYLNPDLLNNYLQNLDFNYDTGVADAAPDVFKEQFHGTAVAGVVAAQGNNSIGVSGAAPNAKITGIKIDDGLLVDNVESQALSHALGAIDIYNNSWGPVDGEDWLFTPGPLTLAAINQGIAQGRNGLGSIYTWAAGNGLADNDNVNYDGYANFGSVMAISAVNDRGKQTTYSEPGAAILVSAPAGDDLDAKDGTVTTDITGNKGYNYTLSAADGDPFPDLNYTETFAGTSAAAPVVAGVVALMLQAKPQLSFRDVRAILVETARKNDPNDPDWKVNGAGYDVNHKYGFGVVDAAAAVELAKNWTPLGAGFFATTGTIVSGQNIPENNLGLQESFTVVDDLTNIEFIEVVVDTTHNYAGDLEIVLTSPAGTKSVLATEHNDKTDYKNWFFGTVRHWGENTAGLWKLSVYDRDSGITGRLNSWQINFFTGPDRAPVAVNDTAQTRPGAAIDINPLTNDSGSKDPTSVAIVGAPSTGTATVLPNGLIHFVPPAGFSGDATIQYTVRSQGGLVSNVGTITVVVNEPPTAVADSVSTAEDTLGMFNVSANDTDTDGSVVGTSVEVTTQPNHGTASVDNFGRVLYTPAANYNGSDTLSYRISDNRGGVSNPVAITINVTPVNDAPTTVNDTAKGVGGAPVVVDVAANDFDIDSSINLATIEIVTAPAAGTAVPNPNGTITVTPPTGFAGIFTFTYAIRDQQGALSQPATVSITASAPPSTIADAASTPEDTAITIDALANDFDVDGVVVRSTLVVAAQPQHGTVTIDASQRFRYTPALNYFGTDTFRYTVRDNEGNTSAPGVVTITITDVNDAPVGKQDAMGMNVNTSTTLNVIANDIDVDGTIQSASLTIPVGAGPTHGTATVNASTGEITYVPAAGYIGPDAFTYLVRDDDGALSGETTVLVRVGRPVSFSGMVYADVNGNGKYDDGEIGVPNAEVAAVMNVGLFKLHAAVRTEEDGTFTIVDDPADGVVLPRGTYSLVQAQPAAFNDGSDTAGTPTPTSSANDGFFGITLAEGASANDYLFAERGLRAQFVSAYLSRRVYFASAAADGSLFGARRGRVFDLSEGEVFFSFDSGAPASLVANATFAPGAGNVQFDVLDNSLSVVKSASSSSGSVAIQVGPGSGPYFLRVSGSADDVLVTSAAGTTAVRIGASLSVGGSTWTPAMLSQLSTSGLGASGLTLSTTTAAAATNPPAPTVPWTNANTISVRFDSPVSVGRTDLHLATASGATYTAAQYSYSSATRTATWILDRPLAADNYLVEITSSTGPIDLRDSTIAPAQLRFSVVPGDANGDGRTTYLDAIAVRNAAGAPSGALAVRSDLDGNGAVNNVDLSLALANSFTTRSSDEVSVFALPNHAVTTGGSPVAAEAVVQRVSSNPMQLAASRVRTRSTAVQAAAQATDAALSNNRGESLSAIRARRRTTSHAASASLGD